MAGTVVCDQGIYRIVPEPETIKKGRWYLGSICPHCQAKIPLFRDPTDGRDPARLVGSGQLSIPCDTCRTDEILLGTSDIISLQADKDGRAPFRFKRVKPSNRPRQPVKTRYSKAKPTFGTRFLEDRPECAVIIARCVSLWSYVETNLALLLASFLKIDYEPAAAIFLAIQNSRIQQQVLRAAAETVLDAKHLELLEAAMNIVASIEKERNDLVHGLYGGGSLFVERGILWATPKDFVATSIAIQAANYRNINTEALRQKTFVYEPEDLETVAQRLEWLVGFIRGLGNHFSFPYDSKTSRAERYRQLCAEPLLAQELSRMREDRKKNPQVQP